MSTKVHPPTAVTFDLPGTVNICTRARRNIEVISFALMMANMFTMVLLLIAVIYYTLYEENLYIYKRRNTDRTLFVQLMV